MKVLDEAYRATEEYADLWAGARANFPGLPQNLFDMALCAHWGNPRAWREKKPPPPPPKKTPEELDIRSVFVEPPKDEGETPVREPVVPEGCAVTVTEVDCDAAAPELA